MLFTVWMAQAERFGRLKLLLLLRAVKAAGTQIAVVLADECTHGVIGADVANTHIWPHGTYIINQAVPNFAEVFTELLQSDVRI
jgi:hypothetical protein